MRSSKPERTWTPLSVPGRAVPAPSAAPAMPAAASLAGGRQRLEPICVTKQQAAEMLNVSESLIDRFIRSGELPVIRAEQRIVRLRVADLHEWAARHVCREESEAAIHTD